jgi:imidazolonepropionase
MPGYVDCHTHLIFGESRVDEYVASFTMNKEEIKNKK